MSATRNPLWDTGYDEPVEVNQRALIDKVLSRYSGEFTVFRELLQNSDDAQATAAEVHFETPAFVSQRKDEGFLQKVPGSSSQDFPDLETLHIHQWVFKNNGMTFREEDWSRLKKIAEGNPNEEKIGAFGVGFYSLFSVTEEPFVTSGGGWMGFYWKDRKDQLFVRRGSRSLVDSQSLWTSFEMPLREPAPIPVAFDLTQFLAVSITFMTNLKEVRVYLDDKCLSYLKKSSSAPREVPIPRGLKSASPLRIMSVTSIKATSLDIKAEVMQGVYPTELRGQQPLALLSGPRGRTFRPWRPKLLPLVGEKGPLTMTTASIALTVFSAEVDAHLDGKLAQELRRAMMKSPPRKLRYELIYTEKDSYDASMLEDHQPCATGSLFQGLRADLEGRGLARIFIGHSTAQTTGLGGHMASRFIPTVERESIDLVDRHVSVWNKELLYVGGFLSRSVYELELDDIRKLWKDEKPPADSQSMDVPSHARNRALHNLKFFAFHASTPSSQVSYLIEEAFFSCASSRPLPIATTAGIRNAEDVRLPDPKLSGFIKQLPVLPYEYVVEAKVMVDCMKIRGIIKQITSSEVLTELRSRSLNEEEMAACLTWWITRDRNYDDTDIPLREFLDVASLVAGAPGAETTLPLSSLQTFISNQSFIIGDGPLPSHVLPYRVSEAFQPRELSTSFPWTEFSIVDWLRHLVSHAVRSADPKYDICQFAPWAKRVLQSLANSWNKLPMAIRDEVATLLTDVHCIPTSLGLKPPPMAYLARIDRFSDLPVVILEPYASPSMVKVLCHLGVRKRVDLRLLINDVINTGNWTTCDLTKYLVKMDDTGRLSEDEIDYIQTCAVFTAELSSSAAGYRACELYQPTDIHRRLGLSILSWENHTRWRDNSKDAQFLYRIGLHKFPPLDVIIELAAGSDATVRQIAFQCLLDDMYKHYNDYDRKKFDDKKFVPTFERLDIPMASPNEVFVRPEWASLGFLTIPPSILDDALTKLKISENPPASMLIALLETRPPTDLAQAQKWFGLLSSQISAFSTRDLECLSDLPIVPAKRTSSRNKGGGSVYMKPRECYIGAPPSAPLRAEIFAFVDFGPEANRFLTACGSKHEPSVEDIALSLLSDPWKFYSSLNDRESFLDELRNLAHNVRSISQQTLRKMRQTPFLLSSRRVSRTASQSSVVDENEIEYTHEDDLRRPNQIIIEDDHNLYRLFGDSIFIAPHESKLEDFYTKLGSRPLSSVVRNECEPTNKMGLSKDASDIRSLVLERLPLLLHEHPDRTKATCSCFKNGEKFFVKVFGHLSVSTILDYGGDHLLRTQNTTAFAKHTEDDSVQVELWLAGNMEVDMYDVASSVVPLVLKYPKAGDIFLFTNILMTNLQTLKKRGFNVDRILRQQQEKELANSEHILRTIKPAVEKSTQWTHSTFRSHITSRINSAIGACATERGGSNQYAQKVPIVNESINYGYCDISGNVNVTCVDVTNGTKFYACRNMVNPKMFLKTKVDMLQQFLNKVIWPLCGVYNIPCTCIHVFYQLDGDLIAFNRKGDIFLNLRCYEAWHKSDVKDGHLSKACISWYFILAHEIAHNLVEPHNLEHEIYFSALCEEHIHGLWKLLH